MTDDKEKPVKDVITVEEVAALLGPPRRTIYEAMHKKPDFPKPFKVGRSYFFLRAEVIAYREKLQAEFAARNSPPTKEQQDARTRRRNAAWEYNRMQRCLASLQKPKK